MSLSKVSCLAVGVAIGVAVAASQLAGAASTPIGELGSNEGVFVNKTTFKIVKGASKGDPQAQIVKLGARPVSDATPLSFVLTGATTFEGASIDVTVTVAF